MFNFFGVFLFLIGAWCILKGIYQTFRHGKFGDLAWGIFFILASFGSLMLAHQTSALD